MGNKIELKLDNRSVHGKKVAQLRKESIVPAVVYGPGMEPISVQAQRSVLEKAYRQAGTHTPVHLTVDGKKRIAMIKDVEYDVVKHTLSHVAFHAVNADEPVVAEVPIVLTGEGESEAEKSGLVVLQSLDKIEVKALPMDLPEALEVSILGLKDAGEKITVADIVIPKSVELVDNNAGSADDEEAHSITELVVVTVYEPSALQAANEAAGGDAEDAAADSVESENGTEESSKEDDKSA